MKGPASWFPSFVPRRCRAACSSAGKRARGLAISGLTGRGGEARGLAAVTYEGDAPAITFAPTGAGKGRGALIPNALLHDGPLLAIDIKGELAACCDRHRQRLGQRVVVLNRSAWSQAAAAA